jgi:hypothetical protein
MLHHILPQVIPHFIGIPSGSGDEVLEIRRRLPTEFLGQLPAVLPLDTTDQPTQIMLRMSPQIPPRKPQTYHTSHGVKLSSPVRNFLISRHPCPPRINSEKVQNNRKSGNCNCSTQLTEGRAMKQEPNRLEELITSLKQQRDKLSANRHLPGMEMRDEWNRMDARLA